ncbi:hypothetical protein KKE26_03080, partial [bacterium]|nr:hypothetical protein [bacterium]
DGNEQSKISGATGWTQISYSIPSGTHTLKWAYTKDSSVSSGSDCGWLDKVEFIPRNKITGVISYPGTKTGSLYYSAFDNPQFTGIPTAGGTGTFSSPGTISYTLEVTPGTYYLRVYIDVDNNKTPTVGDPIDIYGSLSTVYYPWQVIGTPTPVNIYNYGTITFISDIDFVLSRKVEEKVFLPEAVDAVDNPEFIGWETGGGGTALWFGQSNYYCYGIDAAQSGVITDSQQTYIQTQVLGTATLTFYWKVSSQSGSDYLRFYIDGDEQNKISGEAGWTKMSYFIPSGTHILKWEYKKDSSGSIGSDCGWLDRVEFIPWGGISGVISYTGQKKGTLHYAAFDNPQFTGSFGGGGIVELLAGQSESGWGASNDPFQTNYHDSRAQSVYLASDLIAAGIGAGKITALQLKCYQGPGRPNLKNFRIRMKQTPAVISTAWETTGWTSVFGPTDIIPTAGQWYNFVLSTPFVWDGVSNLLIDFSRDDNNDISGGGMYVRTGLTNRTYSGYSDSGYTWPFNSMSGSVQNHVPSLRVEFISEGAKGVAKGTATFNGPGVISYALEVPPGRYYLRAYIDICNDGGPTEYDPVGIYGSLSTVYYPWQVIGTPTAVDVYSRIISSGRDFMLSHKVIVKDFLGEALDNTELTWISDEAANWLREYTVYCPEGEGDAAQSDDITDNQQTYIQTQVLGTATLTFYWKVSSQSGSDYLRFYIDGNIKNYISGEAGWMKMSYFIPAGTHTLKWVYTKDSSGSNGFDCGWLDRVEFIPWGGINGVISYPGTKTGSLYYSAFTNPQFTGIPIAGGTGTFSSPGTISYTLTVPAGTYYIRAYLDADNDKSPSGHDPVDIHGSLSTAYCQPWQVIGTPTPVIVYSGSDTLGIDFVLSQEVKQSLGDAVDNTELIWTTSGNADWFRQTVADFTYDGEDAAQSGDITDSQQTSI